MAYATSDHLVLLTTAALGTGLRVWFHKSADTGAAADADGFITDGIARGLKVGDLVWHEDTSTKIITSHRVFASTIAPTTAVDLGDGTTIASGTNSD